MTHYEMTDALIKKGKISDRVLQARKKGVSTYDENGGHVFLGLKASEWKSKIFRKIKKDVKELIGMAASPGTIKGIVKVLISTLQANKLKKGEILVTSHTTPDWVKIMKRATAIITERGGITCHAAIISRELGVPCVTGIANATEILKDGGLVEVNGTKGIVKRVKR